MRGLESDGDAVTSKQLQEQKKITGGIYQP